MQSVTTAFFVRKQQEFLLIIWFFPHSFKVDAFITKLSQLINTFAIAFNRHFF